MKLTLRTDGSGFVPLPSFSSVTEVKVYGVTTSAYTVVEGQGVQLTPAAPADAPIEITFVDNPQMQSIEDGAAKVTSVAHTKRYDQVDSTTAYLGEAVCGSAESSPSWRIQKLTFTPSGGVTILFADGDANFNNVWANRTSLSYS